MITFKLIDPNISVVAFLSQVLQKLPNPDRRVEWPPEAWLP
jgi:hypothetical protein